LGEVQDRKKSPSVTNTPAYSPPPPPVINKKAFFNIDQRLKIHHFVGKVLRQKKWLFCDKHSSLFFTPPVTNNKKVF
jgi:hypothetical protein